MPSGVSCHTYCAKDTFKTAIWLSGSGTRSALRRHRVGALHPFGMANWALQNADRGEVLEPANVREAVAERIRDLNRKYGVEGNSEAKDKIWEEFL